MSDDLINRLRDLGLVRRSWSKGADSYFSHRDGRVSLSAARDFFNKSINLCEEAADEIERLKNSQITEKK